MLQAFLRSVQILFSYFPLKFSSVGRMQSWCLVGLLEQMQIYHSPYLWPSSLLNSVCEQLCTKISFNVNYNLCWMSTGRWLVVFGEVPSSPWAEQILWKTQNSKTRIFSLSLCWYSLISGEISPAGWWWFM